VPTRYARLQRLSPSPALAANAYAAAPVRGTNGDDALAGAPEADRIQARGGGDVAADCENVKSARDGKPGAGHKPGRGPEGQPPFNEDGAPGRGRKPA
jgi:hypothetical protein